MATLNHVHATLVKPKLQRYPAFQHTSAWVLGTASEDSLQHGICSFILADMMIESRSQHQIVVRGSIIQCALRILDC